MDYNEVRQIAQDYGYYACYSSSIGDKFDSATFRNNDATKRAHLTIFANGDFQFTYTTIRGAMKLSSGRCGDVKNESHFRTHEKFAHYYARVLYINDNAFID